MQPETANEFYERIVEGTKNYKEISLEHASGATLEGVRMHPVDKRTLASVIERLPEEMFDMAQEAEAGDSPEDALEEEELGPGAITAESVEAFENLVKKSLAHPELSSGPMEKIIDNLAFETLFDLGAQIINLSFENSDGIKDFHERE